MAMSSEISVGLAHELVITACKAGFAPRDLSTLSKSEETFRDVLSYLRGDLQMVAVEHIIDCDIDPPLPQPLKADAPYEILSHNRSGKLVWNPNKIELYNGEVNEKGFLNKPLGKSLKRKQPLGANVAFFLNERPWLVPDSWRFKERKDDRESVVIYFFGTQYWSAGGPFSLFRGKKVPEIVGLALRPNSTVLIHDTPDKFYRDPQYHFAAVLAE